MKINSIRIQNFRNIHSLETSLKHINYVFGLNNSGKSSLLAACQYAICNNSPFSSKLDELMKKNIEDPKEYSIVEANIDKLGSIRRQKRKSSQTNSLNGVDMPDKELAKEFKNQFGYDYSIAELMFDGAHFTTMSPKEQKAFLLKLTGISLNAEQIIKYMDNPTQNAITKVTNTINLLLGDNPMSIDDIEKIYQSFFSERTILKKEYTKTHSELEIKTKELPKEKPRIITFVENELQVLEDKLQSLIKEKTIYNERISIYNSALKTIEEQTKQLEIINSEIIEDLDISEENISNITNEIHKLEITNTGNSRELGALIQSRTSFEKMQTKLNTDKCPLSEKLICKTDKSPLLKEFKEEIENISKRITTLEKENEVVSKKLLELKQKLETIREQKILLTKKDNILSIINKEKQIIQDTIIKNIVDKSNDIETINKRIEELRKEKNEIISYNNAKKEIEQLKAKFNNLEQDVSLIEYLVKEFAPNGVRSRILKKIIAPLQVKASNTISKLTNDYSLEFNIDDNGFEVNVTTKTGTIPLSQLSESEKLRLQIVIQDTINSLTGVGILVIDEAGVLDKENFEKLSILIEEISKNYGSIFVLATKEYEDAKEFSYTHNNENTQVIWMEQGILSNL